MVKGIENVKNLYHKVKNSSSEARYKAVLKANSVFTSLMRYVVLITIGYIILYPIFYMLSSSIRTRNSFLDPSVVWITPDITFEHYSMATKLVNYTGALLNTVVFELIAAAIQIISCSVAAYGLARFEFKEKKILTFFMFLLILVPSQMMMIPIVTTYTKLDLLGVLGPHVYITQSNNLDHSGFVKGFDNLSTTVTDADVGNLHLLTFVFCAFRFLTIEQ